MNNNLLLLALLASAALIYSVVPNGNDKEQIDEVAVKEWSQWRKLHGKFYSSVSEQTYRYEVFKNTYFLIQIHNSNPENTFQMGLNQFSDLTKAEFAAIFLSGPSRKASPVSNETTNPNILQDSVNWVDQGMVPEVRNMGQCQASYAFSAVSVVESLFRIDTDNSVYLSPEQIIQCSGSYGNNGCDGGYNTNTLTYVSRKKLNTESDYPYTSAGGTTGECNYAQEDKGRYHSETIEYIPNDCGQVQGALYNQPVYACIVPGFKLQYYEGGVFPASECTGNDVSYCMSLVGSDGSSYWLLQNSWGSSWGENGYIRIQYGNSCQICSDALQPGFT